MKENRLLKDENSIPNLSDSTFDQTLTDWKNNQQGFNLVKWLTLLKTRAWSIEDVENLEGLIAVGVWGLDRKTVERIGTKSQEN